MKRLVRQFDMTMTNHIAQLPDSWHGFFMAITVLGDPILTVGIGLVVAAVGFVENNIRLALSGGVVLVTLVIGGMLKLLFGRARPLTEYAANLRIDTFSFPSGHSSGAMIAYGLLAYIAIKLLPQPYGIIVAIFCALIILLVGLSRVYLGAHFPSDVLAGWLLGGSALFIVIFLIRPLA